MPRLGPGAINPDFLDLLRALLDAGARFLVVGAQAMAAHGVPRATGDMDVWVEPTEANADAVWQALLAFGAPVEAFNLSVDDFTASGNVVQIGGTRTSTSALGLVQGRIAYPGGPRAQEQ